MTDNLKPCPFCGGEPTSSNEFDDEVLFYGCTKDIDCPLYDAPFVNLENWNTRPIEDELNRRIAKAKDLLNAEMGMWRSVPTGNLPDHFIQLRQVLDVLDGGGE